MSRNFLICLFLAFVTIAVYAKVIHFDFVHLDDGVYVVYNEHVWKGLTPEGFVWAIKATHSQNWHPLTWLSHMVDCQIFGSDAGRHHLTNLALHVVNTLLLFGLLKHLTGRVGPSVLVAALFAVHPLHVESVAWVSERKDVLSTCFGLLAIWAYARYARRGSLGTYLLVVGFMTLGLMAKPMLVTLPLVLLLLDYWPLERFARPIGDLQTVIVPRSPQEAGRKGPRYRQTSLSWLIIEKSPLLVMSVLSSVVTYKAQQSGAGMQAAQAITMSDRLANALVSYVRYIAKAIWPADLSPMYPHPYLPGGTPWSGWQIVGAFLVLLTISALVLLTLTARHRYFVMGWLWYLGTLVPVIGLVQVGTQAMADRYTYIPLIGLFIMAAWGAADFFSGLAKRFEPARFAATVVAVAIVSAFAASAWSQTRHWRSSLSLLEQISRQALNANPDSAHQHGNLGVLLLQQGKVDEAIGHFRRATELEPGLARAHYNLGAALKMKGQFSGAMNHFQKAVSLRPEWPEALNRLAWILATYPSPDARQPDKAIALARLAANLTEYGNATILDTLATAYAAGGQFEQAVETERRALVVASVEPPNTLVPEIRRRLDLYRREETYHERPGSLRSLRPMIPQPDTPLADQ